LLERAVRKEDECLYHFNKSTIKLRRRRTREARHKGRRPRDITQPVGLGIAAAVGLGVAGAVGLGVPAAVGVA
jgi:hypothetical protein